MRSLHPYRLPKALAPHVDFGNTQWGCWRLEALRMVRTSSTCLFEMMLLPLRTVTMSSMKSSEYSAVLRFCEMSPWPENSTDALSKISVSQR